MQGQVEGWTEWCRWCGDPGEAGGEGHELCPDRAEAPMAASVRWMVPTAVAVMPPLLAFWPHTN